MIGLTGAQKRGSADKYEQLEPGTPGLTIVQQYKHCMSFPSGEGMLTFINH